jgi:hypothetical protein
LLLSVSTWTRNGAAIWMELPGCGGEEWSIAMLRWWVFCVV